MLIQLCGLAVVILYYTWPTFASACEHIAQMKKEYGYAFSGIAGVIAGAIVPETFKVMTMRDEKLSRKRLKDLFFACFYFAFMAMLCDGLYRLLDIVIGSEPTTKNAILKTLCDQGLFTPTLGTGIASIYFPLYRSGWDFRSIFKGFGFVWFVKINLPVLLPAWCYWIPMCVLMYSLPSLLQVPFSVSATAAWGLLVVVIASRKSGT